MPGSSVAAKVGYGYNFSHRGLLNPLMSVVGTKRKMTVMMSNNTMLLDVISHCFVCLLVG